MAVCQSIHIYLQKKILFNVSIKIGIDIYTLFYVT